MRCFIALPLPEALAGALASLAEAAPVGHPVPRENLHLTLAFLGEQGERALAAAHEGLEAVQAQEFALRLRGLGSFGAPRPHTLWAGVASEAPVAALHGKVLAALHGAGLMLPRRRFRPHVTLARLPPLDGDDERRLANFLQRWQDYPAPEVTVTRFALFRSTLGKGAPRYEVLAEYPLRPARMAPTRE